MNRWRAAVALNFPNELCFFSATHFFMLHCTPKRIICKTLLLKVHQQHAEIASVSFHVIPSKVFGVIWTIIEWIYNLELKFSPIQTFSSQIFTVLETHQAFLTQSLKEMSSCHQNSKTCHSFFKFLKQSLPQATKSASVAETTMFECLRQRLNDRQENWP